MVGVVVVRCREKGDGIIKGVLGQLGLWTTLRPVMQDGKVLHGKGK
jgi:hypothetical protein